MTESVDDPKTAPVSGAAPDERRQSRPAAPGVDAERADGAAEMGAESSERPDPVSSPEATDPAKVAGQPTPDVAGDPQAQPEVDPHAYHVVLPEFEGPLDLLLHLIQKHELDILNIPIGFIAKKYVEYLKLMDTLSIDVASEYLVMAATLAHIKSKSLLPPDPNAPEDELQEEEEDPRAELIRRLLEYQKYKQAADQLGGRSVLGRDVFPRGIPVEASTDPAPLAQLSLFKLVDAFEDVLKRAKQVEDHQIDFERISISEKIGEISELLRARGRLEFVELFEGEITRVEMIVTFLALLEMTKLRMTHIHQDDPMGPIFVELSVTDDEEPLDFAAATRYEDPPQEDDGTTDEEDVLGLRAVPREQDQLADDDFDEREPDSDDFAEASSDANHPGADDARDVAIEQELAVADGETDVELGALDAAEESVDAAEETRDVESDAVEFDEASGEVEEEARDVESDAVEFDEASGEVEEETRDVESGALDAAGESVDAAEETRDVESDAVEFDERVADQASEPLATDVAPDEQASTPVVAEDAGDTPAEDQWETPAVGDDGPKDLDSVAEQGVHRPVGGHETNE